MTPLVVTIPLRTKNSLNVREHWAKRALRAKHHRATVGFILRAYLRNAGIGPPCVVTLTRTGPKRMDDDGLSAALKAVRDGVADALGIDDGSDAVEWRYAQTKGKPGVEIRVEAQAATSSAGIDSGGTSSSSPSSTRSRSRLDSAISRARRV